MTTVVIGCDSNGNNRYWQDTVASIMKKNGYSIEKLSIGPTPFGSYGYENRAKGKIGIYLMAASLTSVTDLCPGCNWKFEKTFFIIRGDVSVINTEEKFNSRGIHKDREGDCLNKWCDQWQGKTYPQINQYIAQKGGLVVFGANPTSGANKVLEALGNPQVAYRGSNGKTYKSSYDGSLQGNSDSNISPLIQGEMTFEELIGEICKGVDLMFLCKRSTVVVTDFSTIYAEAQYLRDNHYSAVSDEDIKMYQLEEDSYELNINNHGFYNTVYVHYKNGVIRETFDDFVTVYGEVAIDYYDKKIDKTTAQMKAKAYLAAHLRDFEMTVEATILSNPEIDIGDIVTLDNPKSNVNELKTSKGGKPEYLFVKGVNTNWEGDSKIESSLELQFSPTSPLKKEVPTAGTWSDSS